MHEGLDRQYDDMRRKALQKDLFSGKLKPDVKKMGYTDEQIKETISGRRKLQGDSFDDFSGVAFPKLKILGKGKLSDDEVCDTPNGCLAHGMKRHYGAVIAEPQGVTIKDNSTGVFGFGRSSITSVSLVSDSIYDQVIPEIYTDSEMPVNCKVAAGRDESDFYEALGIVGEGPPHLLHHRALRGPERESGRYGKHRRSLRRQHARRAGAASEERAFK